MDKIRLRKHKEVRNRISKIVGNETKHGSLRSQVYEITKELGHFGGITVIKKKSFPNPVGNMKRKFFTPWAVMALSRLIDSSNQCKSILGLLKLLNSIREEGELERDRWIERVGKIEVDDWRAVKEKEFEYELDILRSKNGVPAWFPLGPGVHAGRLNIVWNKLTGREEHADGSKDEMDQWVLDSALQPINCCSAVKLVQKLRNEFVEHQDKKKMEMDIMHYDSYLMETLIQAYSSIITASHRTILLAEGFGLQNLNSISTFSVSEALSAGDQNENQINESDLLKSVNYINWQQFLWRSEETWYKELRALRKKHEMPKK